MVANYVAVFNEAESASSSSSSDESEAEPALLAEADVLDTEEVQKAFKGECARYPGPGSALYKHVRTKMHHFGIPESTRFICSRQKSIRNVEVPYVRDMNLQRKCAGCFFG